VWLTFLLFVSDFNHDTSALLFCFVLEAEPASSWNLKSVGAQLSARLLFSAQILAIERKLALASAQFLAED
jgi:hypothetical protein